MSRKLIGWLLLDHTSQKQTNNNKNQKKERVTSRASTLPSSLIAFGFISMVLGIVLSNENDTGCKTGSESPSN